MIYGFRIPLALRNKKTSQVLMTCEVWYSIKISLFLPKLTMLDAIGKIYHQANDHPYTQTKPVRPAETINHNQADKNSEYWHQWHQWSFEFPWQLGLLHPHNPYSCTYQDKGEQGSDTGHIPYYIAWDKCCK